ncbi:MAG TPA: pilus assembly protein PilZ [Geobacteraceae bacterium]|nr:pilus assembly protein PilZ [Geobacteraceae bacterium]
MADKRDITRFRKRLPLKFGFDAPNKVAFTEDLSHDGLFVKTVYPSPPGSKIHIELTMPDGNAVHLVGMSRWRKSVPPQVIHLMKKCGMGIKILKFISGEDSYRLLITKLNEKR